MTKFHKQLFWVCFYCVMALAVLSAYVEVKAYIRQGQCYDRYKECR